MHEVVDVTHRSDECRYLPRGDASWQRLPEGSKPAPKACKVCGRDGARHKRRHLRKDLGCGRGRSCERHRRGHNVPGELFNDGSQAGLALGARLRVGIVEAPSDGIVHDAAGVIDVILLAHGAHVGPSAAGAVAGTVGPPVVRWWVCTIVHHRVARERLEAYGTGGRIFVAVLGTQHLRKVGVDRNAPVHRW